MKMNESLEFCFDTLHGSRENPSRNFILLYRMGDTRTPYYVYENIKESVIFGNGLKLLTPEIFYDHEARLVIPGREVVKLALEFKKANEEVDLIRSWKVVRSRAQKNSNLLDSIEYDNEIKFEGLWAVEKWSEIIRAVRKNVE